jgi:F-type H+-transporting ATPase subunit b
MTKILVAETNTTKQHGSSDGAATHEGTEAHGGEVHSSVFPPFDPSTFGSQLLWLALAFGALYLLMSRVALPRIGEILEVRRDRIEGDLAEADRMRQKTDQAIEAYETALAEAKSKAHTIAEETRNAMKADLEAKQKAVSDDLADKMSTAEARIAEAKSAAMEHVGEIATETAQALVTPLIGKVTVTATKSAVAKVVKG